MHRRRDKCIEWSLRLATAGVALMLALGPASAQSLLPPDYFNQPITPGGAASIEANTLTFDTPTGNVIATGDIVFAYQGYRVRGEHLVYNRRNGEARFRGPVTIRDPSGNVLEGTDFELTGGMRLALVEALSIRGYDGTLVTADSAEYDEAVRTVLNNMTYAPCGECIDRQGRRIGWSIRATRFEQNNEDKSLAFENPVLEILGVPVAWLPYLWLPDLSDTILDDIEAPGFEYTDEQGLAVFGRYRAYSSAATDIIFTPRLMSRQGALMGVEWVQRFDQGSFRVRASGLYQLDPGAYSNPEAQREWRGAIQAAGSFRPVREWLVGWSYTAFTDAAYLHDYSINRSDAARNEVYATHVSPDTYIDARVQQFNELGSNVLLADQAQQGAALPNLRAEHIMELGDGLGRLEVSGRLLGVRRDADAVRRGHVQGFAGEKLHGTAQVGWQEQWIAPMGVAVTPYAGLRIDGARYDGTSVHPWAPPESALVSATPIAALDVRWPWAANDGANVHVIEPIAQIVYRGSSESRPGITNDDAQSFAFDDTNLFSYNRFSGLDRQETGLRANVGGRFTSDFANGSYLELVAGQSFHLAGPNAFEMFDPAHPGATVGLAGTASYAVLGAYARLRPEIFGVTPRLDVGGKLQIDPDALEVTRGGLGVAATFSGGYRGSLDYLYEAANPAARMNERHEIAAELNVPLMDYWSVSAGAAWDLAQNTWLQVSGGLLYDDGYLEVGANASVNGPTHRSPNDRRATVSIMLKAPSGFTAGYSGAVPINF